MEKTKAKPSDVHRIRPAGRHILTIGRDLIQDHYAAIIELVKNAYDADSPDVKIEFKDSKDGNGYTLSIADHGHGMTRDTVINKWMVPSTKDKLERRVSPQQRTMQGRKGIGRYAASILGEDLLLETVTSNGEKTTVYVEWKSFEKAEYLEDVEILVETEQVEDTSGTRLLITGNAELLRDWNQRQFDNLIFELKKLTPPLNNKLKKAERVEESTTEKKDDFCIDLEIKTFLKGEPYSIEERIVPYPIFDLFDYKISGTIKNNGQGVLTYICQKARNTIQENIPFELPSPTHCGELVFDIRVYDRDSEAIDSLISRGLKDESGKYVGKLQARQILDQYNGVGVYRNGFRIRPLGDADFDWLKLNEQRVQNPSMRIGSNQVIGFVQIQPEEQSGLIEKSARDGLKDNPSFEQLKEVTKSVIGILEDRRFRFRKKTGLGRSALKVESELEKLFSFDELKRGIRNKLSERKIDKNIADEIIAIINREAEDQNKIVDEIRQAVAVYQGQATLGKIINVILHEGRKPLNYFKNQSPNLKYWYESFKKSGDNAKLEKILPLVDGFENNADVFVKLFSRLDPLAAGKRSAKKVFPLKSAIENSFSVFEHELERNKISVYVTGADDFKFESWPQDIYAIVTNLVDNSIFWMCAKSRDERKILVDIHTDGTVLLYIDYKDTGPGIEPSLIESEVIFEPQFSTKPDGTGLGLAIAGEAAARNGLELKAMESEIGAYFRLQPRSELK